MVADTLVPMGSMTRLENLFKAEHSCIAVTTFEEAEAAALVREVAAARGLALWEWSSAGGLREALLSQHPPIPDTGPAPAALYYLLTNSTSRRCVVFFDLITHLEKDARNLRLWRELLAAFARERSTMVLVDHQTGRPAVIDACSTRFDLPLPDEKSLERLIRSTLRQCADKRPVQVNLSRPELDLMIRNLRGLSERVAGRIINDVIAQDGRFDASDINHILAEKRRTLQGMGMLEYVESPVSLDDVGGLRRLKHWLNQRQRAFSEEAAAFGLPAPRGVLMLGVQGAGKSLAAKACATAWGIPLLRMDVGALYDRYIGESERQLRDTLRQAEMMSPIVLWIDEIEKAFASAASRSSDGGLSQRMFGTLLTWMQEKRSAVFLIATANDIEALPPELLRKGRFDEIFFVDLPTDEARQQIFEIHLRKRRCGAMQLEELVRASAGFSGAEIEQAVVSALHEAFAQRTELSTALILDAIKASPPLSVTMRERVAALREWAHDRCVPAD